MYYTFKVVYLIHSWCHPALVVKQSKINGQGIFTAKPIPAGQKVMIFGGKLVDRKETDNPKYREMSFFPISGDKFLASTVEAKDEYLNHSCEPNIWLVDEVTTTAIRDINSGEEITLDCATWDCNQEWIYSETGQCSCGSSQCRKTLSPDDWRKPAIRQKYRGHFAPYIQKKIDKMKSL